MGRMAEDKVEHCDEENIKQVQQEQRQETHYNHNGEGPSSSSISSISSTPVTPITVNSTIPGSMSAPPPCDSNKVNGLSPPSSSSSSSIAPNKSSAKKEESPFSFKHFLKRDLSLPSTSSAANLEGTGAKPKVYSGSAHPSHPSLSKLDQPRESDEKLPNDSNDPDSDVKNKEAIKIFDRYFSFKSNSNPNEQLGMPSLPDFVQDHILVEQAYLGTGAPLSVDFENLPDFTINLNADSDRERNVSRPRSQMSELYEVNRECGPSIKNSSRSCKSVPVDLGAFGDEVRNGENAEPTNPVNDDRPFPLDLPNHISLDLTDSLNHSHRRDNNRTSFPLDLPETVNSAGESLRLPDFLPAQAGNGNTASSLHREDFAEERRLRLAAERELRAALQTSASLRRELSDARSAEYLARRDASEARANAAKIARHLHGGGRMSSSSANTSTDDDSYSKRGTSDDNLVARLRLQISQLQDELTTTRTELEQLKNGRRNVSRSLTQATNSAETSLRELLSGLDQLRGLASSLDPP